MMGMKIICNCGEQLILDDKYNFQKDNGSKIDIDADMSCNLSIKCGKCGYEFSRCFWC
jgi:hypothetical protein